MNWNWLFRKKKLKGLDAVAESYTMYIEARTHIMEAKESGTVQRVPLSCMIKILKRAKADLPEVTARFMMETGGATLVDGVVYTVEKEK